MICSPHIDMCLVSRWQLCPFLSVSRCKHCIEDSTNKVDRCSNVEDYSPLSCGLWEKNGLCYWKHPIKSGRGYSLLKMCWRCVQNYDLDLDYFPHRDRAMFYFKIWRLNGVKTVLKHLLCTFDLIWYFVSNTCRKSSLYNFLFTATQILCQI